MKTYKYVLTALAGVALGGCADWSGYRAENDTLRNTTAQNGTPFTKALTDEYRSQMNAEADPNQEDEVMDASFFAEKGLRAAKGEVVLPSSPEDVQHWTWRTVRHGELGPIIQIPDGRVADLAAARFRLVTFLDGGGRTQKPLLAAHAQGLYDCWLEEEWESDPDMDCGASYLKIESQFTIEQVATTSSTSMPEQNRTVAYGPKMDTFQVFFDFDKSAISSSAAKIIDEVAANAKQHGTSASVNLTGHTDASGTAAYNQKLSERRAKAVMERLVKDGVPTAEINSVGVGKDGQLVPTADGVREPQNRRTEIIIK